MFNIINYIQTRERLKNETIRLRTKLDIITKENDELRKKNKSYRKNITKKNKELKELKYILGK